MANAKDRVGPISRMKSAQHPSLYSATLILVLLSRDRELTERVKQAARSEWTVISRDVDQLTGLIREPNLGLVVFDDQSVAAADRGWALSEIRRCAPRASIVYIANQHDHDNERARARGVVFYTAKPLIPGDVRLALERLLRMHNGRPDLRIHQSQTRIRQS
jgi:hypothetical protein